MNNTPGRKKFTDWTIHQMQMRRTTRAARVQSRENEASKASIELIDTAMFLSCSLSEFHQKGDFTPARTKVNYFKFPKLLSHFYLGFHTLC